MTTILVADGNGRYTVAYDRRTTYRCGEQDRHYTDEKAVKVPKRHGDGFLVLAGEADTAMAVVRPFLTRGRFPRRTGWDIRDLSNFDACWVAPHGVFLLKGGCVWSPVDIRGKCLTLGSGGNAAAGAYLAGASPKRSVKIACEIDPHSGGGVRTLSVKKEKTNGR